MGKKVFIDIDNGEIYERDEPPGKGWVELGDMSPNVWLKLVENLKKERNRMTDVALESHLENEALKKEVYLLREGLNPNTDIAC